MLFVILFAYMRRLLQEKLRKLADVAAERAKTFAPVMLK